MPVASPHTAPAAVDASANGSAAKPAEGLSSEEARRLYEQFGPNSMPDTSSHPARMGRDPGEIYRELTREFGEPLYDRVDAPATPDQKELLAKLSAQQVKLTELAGEKIQTVLTHAPGNGAPIGGLKVVAQSGWFAARPSGTEDIYKLYAESFRGADHLRRILEEAQATVNDALTAAPEAKEKS